MGNKGKTTPSVPNTTASQPMMIKIVRCIMRIVIKLNGYFTTGERIENSPASGDAAKSAVHPARAGYAVNGACYAEAAL
ncbi:hypothetical protein NMCA_13470 [Enterobacter ludwigii]|nr:hypothetical protein NMCA_13470 [Enterobacter ludwigii]